MTVSISELWPPLARTPSEWADTLRPYGARAFHGKQLFRWVFARGVMTADGMTDLPLALRERIGELDLPGVARVTQVHRSQDATRKLLVTFRDGATVETVLIPGVTGGPNGLPSPVEPLDADLGCVDDDDDDEPPRSGRSPKGGKDFAPPPVRVTQCISTQVGCAMGCAFCASGIAGLKRHLGGDEIVAQLLLGKAHLDEGEALRNVVFMGMGEPLHNYDATRRALELMLHPDGLNLSARRITVSTSGLVPEIAKLGKDFSGQVGLAISLHATTDEARSLLMPVNRRYPIPELMRALKDYPLPKRRRITIEYTLIRGENDSADDARRLTNLLKGIPVKVNLIPMNPVEASQLGPPSLEHVLEFQKRLTDAGYSCFIRRRRGDDVAAACGQLAILGAKRKVRAHRQAGATGR